MNNEILYVLLSDWADHEPVFLATAITCEERGMRSKPKYVNKIVAPSLGAIKSCAGFSVMPDYSFETMPQEYAALILIGGYGWLNESEACKVVPVVKNAIKNGIVVGAICNAASFLAKHGFLNNIKHTGNGIEQLKLWGGSNYANEQGYQNLQAVSDNRIVTANGTGSLEFAKELLLLLENDTPEEIEKFYQFNKIGFSNLVK